MGKIRTVSLSNQQRQELEAGYQNGSTHAFRKRCQIVLLKSQPRSSKIVSEAEVPSAIVGMVQLSVNHWLTRYEQEGIEGLKTKPGRGAKPKLDVKRDAQHVKQAVQKHRQQSGSPFRLRQAKAEIEQQIGHRISQRTLTRFLKKLVQATAEEVSANAFASG